MHCIQVCRIEPLVLRRDPLDGVSNTSIERSTLKVFLCLPCPSSGRRGASEQPSIVRQQEACSRILGFSDAGFAALKDVSGSEDASIEVASLSKNLLDNQIITRDLKKHPMEQSFLIHTLARYCVSGRCHCLIDSASKQPRRPASLVPCPCFNRSKTRCTRRSRLLERYVPS